MKKKIVYSQKTFETLLTKTLTKITRQAISQAQKEYLQPKTSNEEYLNVFFAVFYQQFIELEVSLTGYSPVQNLVTADIKKKGKKK